MSSLKDLEPDYLRQAPCFSIYVKIPSYSVVGGELPLLSAQNLHSRTPDGCFPISANLAPRILPGTSLPAARTTLNPTPSLEADPQETRGL